VASAQGEFGLWPFITGTIWVTVTALVLAVPVSILAAIYLSEYARVGPRRRQARHRSPRRLPSVVYGVWGVLLVVPFVGNVLAPLAGVYSSGYSVLAGGLVLAIMTFPTIIHVTLEVFSSVPARSVRPRSRSGDPLGDDAARRRAQGRPGHPGRLGPRILPAFGETMAVLMVVGNVPAVPRSLFDPATPARPDRQQLRRNDVGAALRRRPDGAALVLMLIVLFFNGLAGASLSGRAEGPMKAPGAGLLRRRKRTEVVFRVLTTGSAVVVLLSLLLILGTILWNPCPPSACPC